jgi:folate-binding protein YgfZ
MPVVADLSRWWKFEVSGSDARSWLNDIVTNSVDDLSAHETRRTLLLDRTGHIQADLHVFAMPDESLLLVQDPVQPRPIGELLAPYVLSSDVQISERTSELGLLCHPHAGHVLIVEAWHPGILDSGFDQVIPAAEVDARRPRSPTFLSASEQDVEVWRILSGRPRFGVDMSEDALPAEAGLESLIDTTKGCFLGQESVARVRNLGHPPRLVRPFRAAGRVYPMALILAGGEEVGRITSAVPLDDGEGTACIGNIRWDARDAHLMTTGDFPLAVREPF